MLFRSGRPSGRYWRECSALPLFSSRLHRAKDAQYRDAWKKRGEVLSILANIARKVDRVEYALDGVAAVSGETLVDTAVDLFVYCLKYESFLLDLDDTIDTEICYEGSIKKPYSSGTNAFEYLLLRFDLGGLEVKASVETSIHQVLLRFADLEKCFSALEARQPVAERFAKVQALASASADLVGALRSEQSAAYRVFVNTP